jgi:hypothetical protein
MDGAQPPSYHIVGQAHASDRILRRLIGALGRKNGSIKMSQWIISLFSIVGAFFLSGIGGAFIADAFNFWTLPISGFCAAFAVISVAYFAVPKLTSLILTGLFIAGSALAWLMLEPSYYPEHYSELAYQSTHIPFIATISGGAIALVICFSAIGRFKNA